MGVFTWYNLLLLFGIPILLFGILPGIWNYLAVHPRFRRFWRAWRLAVQIISLLLLISGIYGLTVAVMP